MVSKILDLASNIPVNYALGAGVALTGIAAITYLFRRHVQEQPVVQVPPPPPGDPTTATKKSPVQEQPVAEATAPKTSPVEEHTVADARPVSDPTTATKKSPVQEQPLAEVPPPPSDLEKVKKKSSEGVEKLIFDDEVEEDDEYDLKEDEEKGAEAKILAYDTDDEEEIPPSPYELDLSRVVPHTWTRFYSPSQVEHLMKNCQINDQVTLESTTYKISAIFPSTYPVTRKSINGIYFDNKEYTLIARNKGHQNTFSLSPLLV